MQQINRVGESKLMDNGLLATIIGYRRHSDIDVQFEDGAIRANITYTSFKKGIVMHPGTLKKRSASSRIGETRTMRNGLDATIIEYRVSGDITVRFSDGAVKTHVAYANFCKGRVAHQNEKEKYRPTNRVGEQNVMRNGQTVKIIAYRHCTDIDVQFEDGTIVKNTTYSLFTYGKIINPSIKYKMGLSFQEFAIGYYLRQLGFRKVKKREWEAIGFGSQELDFYSDELQVAIEYDGGFHVLNESVTRDLMKNDRCRELGITLYRIRDPKCSSMNSSSIDYIIPDDRERVFELLNCKDELMKILMKHGIVVSEDFIDFNRDYDTIRNEYNATYTNYDAHRRVGETRNMNNGQAATIIEYHNAKDIAVQFEDGTVREHMQYEKFQQGGISNPNFFQTTRVGETNVLTNGQTATITAYRSYKDIDIVLDDGRVCCGFGYDSFVRGYFPQALLKTKKQTGSDSLPVFRLLLLL